MSGAEGSGPRAHTVLEPIVPEPGSFDARTMARGEPGVPRRFAWRGATYEVAEVLGTERETENYSGGARDNYLKRHLFRVRTTSGEVMVLAASRGPTGGAPRWTLRQILAP
jgi:hypothetical protein